MKLKFVFLILTASCLLFTSCRHTKNMQSTTSKKKVAKKKNTITIPAAQPKPIDTVRNRTAPIILENK